MIPHINFRDAALRYAKLGWKVLPLAYGSKVPAIPYDRKQPKHLQGVYLATDDPEQIERWSKVYPRANIGLACGMASGVIVIDIDPRNGGDRAIAELAFKGRVIPPCPKAETGNKGTHLLFRADPRIKNSKNKIGPGIDVKSSGGYIVVAPSWIKPSDSGPGGSYRWIVPPEEIALPRLPVWMSSMLCPIEPPRDMSGDLSGGFFGSRSVNRLARWIERSHVGERNNRLYWASCRCGELVRDRKVSPSAASAALVHAARSVFAESEMPEVRATIQSGLKSSIGGGKP